MSKDRSYQQDAPISDATDHPWAGIMIGMTYAFAFGVYGVLIPFIGLIFKSHGLSDSEISLALTATGLAALIAPLTFGHIADRKLPYNRLMPMLLLCAGASLHLLGISTSLTRAFIATFILYFFLIPALTILDSFTVDFILRNNSSDRPRRFEHYRVWGSAGFILPSLYLLLRLDSSHVNSHHLVMIGVIISLAAALCASFMPYNTPSKASRELPSRVAISAASRPPLRGLFIANLIAGLGLSIFYVLYPRFLQELGCSIPQVGLIINLGVAWEIVMMPFVATIIKRIGLERVVLLGLLTIPIRLGLAFFFPSIAVATVTQALHAPMVIGLFVAVPIYLQTHADSTFRHSLQSLNASVVQGLARFIGPALGALIVSSTPGTALSKILWALLFAGLLGGLAALIFGRAIRPVQREGLSS